MSGARALTLLCHWGNCKTKEDSIMHRRIPPHVRVRLKVRRPQKLRIAAAILIRLGVVKAILCTASGSVPTAGSCTVYSESCVSEVCLHSIHSMLAADLCLQFAGAWWGGPQAE